MIWIKLKLSYHVIKSNDENFERSTSPMVHLGTYEFKDLNTGKLQLKNWLQMLTQKKFINCNISLLLLKNYVDF